MIDVQLFIPCFVDQLYPETGFNMVRILEKLGCRVQYNPNQTCCGQPAFNAGYEKEARAVAEKFLTDFSQDTYVVSPSGSCTGYVRGHYGSLFAQSGLRNKAERLGPRVYEFTEFLVDVLKVESVESEFRARATYHDACGALRECGIKEGPRKLLSRVRGLELVENPESETCCGFGGSFAIKYASISSGMAQTKVKAAMDLGVEYIISTDLSCLMHLQAYIDHEKLPLKTVHIVDVLAAGT